MVGIDPNVFGRDMWKTIHLVALGAPEVFQASDANAYKTFYTQLAYVIPCETCKEHFIEMLHDNPIDNSLSGSESLFEWTFRIHNIVNKRLGKKEVATIEEAKRLTLQSCKNNSSTEKVILSLFIIVACVALGYVGYTELSKKR